MRGLRAFHLVRKLTQFVFSAWLDVRRITQKFHQPVALRLTRAFFEELRSSVDNPDFFGHRSRDPLIQRDAVFFCKPLRSALDRMR